VPSIPSPLCTHVGHRRTAVDFPKADKAPRGLVGRDGWWEADLAGRLKVAPRQQWVDSNPSSYGAGYSRPLLNRDRAASPAEVAYLASRWIKI
jgi:hypothetical protein